MSHQICFCSRAVLMDFSLVLQFSLYQLITHLRKLSIFQCRSFGCGWIAYVSCCIMLVEYAK